jgi:hypothetical protein
VVKAVSAVNDESTRAWMVAVSGSSFCELPDVHSGGGVILEQVHQRGPERCAAGVQGGITGQAVGLQRQVWLVAIVHHLLFELGPPIRQQHRCLPIKRVVHSSDALRIHARSAHHHAVAEALAHLVHRLVQVHGLLRIGEGIHLVAAAHEVTEAHAHQADALAAVVQRAEQLVYRVDMMWSQAV